MTTKDTTRTSSDRSDGDSAVLHSTRYAWNGDRPLTETIHDAISACDPRHDPMDGMPLYSVIEPSHLERLFVPLESDYPRTRGSVAFPYVGYWITLFADGRLTVRDGPPPGHDDTDDDATDGESRGESGR